MTNRLNIVRGVLSLFVFCIAINLCASAQNNESTPLGDKLSFKTNALEWLATIPNFSLEYDIWPDSTRITKGRLSAQITIKYNWATHHEYKPSMVFNVFDVRPELRYYWRPMRKNNHWVDYETKATRKPTFFEWIRYDAFSHLVDNPKTWRTYYTGLYLSYSDYSIKFSPTGRQSGAVGIGGSLGCALPLYEYEKGNIDIELGFSMGFLLHTDFQKYSHDPNGYFYYGLTEPQVKFTPFPVISELRVAFAYRNKSIKDKYTMETSYERKAANHRADVIDAGGHKLYMETQKEIAKAERERKAQERANSPAAKKIAQFKENIKGKFKSATNIFKKKAKDEDISKENEEQE